MSGFLGKTLGKIVGNPSKASQSSASNVATVSSSTTSNANPTATNSNHTGGGSQTTMSSVIAPFLNLTKHTNISQSQAQLNHDAQLTLTHLRKVFYEYLHPKQQRGNQIDQTFQDTSAEVAEREEKLYTILPLFIKAFGHASLHDIQEKFGDVGEFCFACSRLLVNEISKRVLDDLVLVKFFEIRTSEEATDGSGLLNVVNLLASGPPFLIEIMTKCALPSRLVMCIYLFICLPEAKDSILDLCEFNAKERRILFQKCFQQVKYIYLRNYLSKANICNSHIHRGFPDSSGLTVILF